MIYVLAGHITLTPTHPVGSGRPQRESNPGPPHQESRALPTAPPPPGKGKEAEKTKLRMYAPRWLSLNKQLIDELEIFTNPVYHEW